MSRPNLAPAAFFDLAKWAHPDLFAGALNVWEALVRLKEYLGSLRESEIAGEVAPGAWIEGAVRIGPGSRVEPGAYIQGPCIIGRDCEVRHGAYIRGNVLIGDKAVIGHATEVKGSIFLDGAKAGHFAYVGDSILGCGVNLGAGTKLANLRLDGQEIQVRYPGGGAGTGLRKLGAILGDGCETGCNSVTNPGTLLGPGSHLHPCRTARGYWPARSVISGP